ncbi:DUF4349 domain-containing protein [Luteibacter yeojuensis]|uniref:DUF4349 domain-containing protein n=1 Tax=Luteibacter yeojuensis TaxID=345309 RepID=A0A0F3L1W5_9GAMM|nr:DUF4349 domain-containing protein [Luteibacter yeojuensis]KJV37192.1 hypothetical protein VI08_01305 [Luteibacter yeojuensis]
MNRWIVMVAAVAVGLAGCSKKTTVAGAPSVAGEKGRASAMLAYSHQIDVQMPIADIPARIEAVRAACLDGSHGTCNILALDQQSAGGSIAVRVVPEGVQPLSALAVQGGKVTTRRTSAEDISTAVNDTRRERAELEAYGKHLDEIASRTDLAVSDLIAVSKEQAAVAEKRRGLEATAAYQQLRLDTNVLRISFNDPHVRPGGPAFGDIGSGMVDGAIEGTRGALQMAAEGLPYIVIAFPLALLWWLAWRKVTRRWRKP